MRLSASSETIPRITRVTNHSPGESVNTEWCATYIHHDLTWRCVTCVMWHSSPVTCSSRSHEAMIMTIEEMLPGKKWVQIMSNNVKLIRKFQMINMWHSLFKMTLCFVTLALTFLLNLIWTMFVVYAYKKWEQLFFGKSSLKCWKMIRQLEKLFGKILFCLCRRFGGGTENASNVML